MVSLWDIPHPEFSAWLRLLERERLTNSISKHNYSNPALNLNSFLQLSLTAPLHLIFG